MPYLQSQLVEVKRAPGKGRGVFARTKISTGTIIERVPVITVPGEEFYSSTKLSKLADYMYEWEDGVVIIALGYGSIYNHSYVPNASYYSEKKSTQIFVAISDIEPGEEITINYNGDPTSQADVGFQVKKA